MSAWIQLIIIFTIMGMLSTISVLITSRILKRSITKSAKEDRSVILADIHKLNTTLDEALLYSETLIPLGQIQTVENEINIFRKQLAEERAKLLSAEKDLSGFQSSVDEKEEKHNELKKGKEECSRLADELKAEREKLSSEYNRLQGQLEKSKVQMDSLADEVELTTSQKQAMQEISLSLDSISNQLKDLREAQQQASERFLNLQTQYEELEKEFRKLVDKELSGNY